MSPLVLSSNSFMPTRYLKHLTPESAPLPLAELEVAYPSFQISRLSTTVGKLVLRSDSYRKFGSAVVIDERGLALTAYHVVETPEGKPLRSGNIEVFASMNKGKSRINTSRLTIARSLHQISQGFPGIFQGRG